MRWCCARSMCRMPTVCIWWSAIMARRLRPSHSYPDYRDLRDQNRSFDSLVMYDIRGGMGLDTGKGNPSVVWPYMVSGNYFDALGIQPYLGRFIHASEEHGKNSMPEIVLSYALWHSYFNGDRERTRPRCADQQASVHDHWRRAGRLPRHRAFLCAGSSGYRSSICRS